jgi:hypothetical protein
MQIIKNLLKWMKRVFKGCSRPRPEMPRSGDERDIVQKCNKACMSAFCF